MFHHSIFSFFVCLISLGTKCAEPQVAAKVDVCHYSEQTGQYSLLHVPATDWEESHAAHARDCCRDALVCGQQRLCGTAELPWAVDDKLKTCTPVCAAGLTWDSQEGRCKGTPSACAGDPCAATATNNFNGSCFAAQPPGTGYTCGCVADTAWANGACTALSACAGFSTNPCAAVTGANLFNGTCIDGPPASNAFSCGCITGATWSGGGCVGEWAAGVYVTAQS
uniref:EGF-like domain-containing protein n=1 Tax=Tetradesmus obliquus TaxID=3088 RepID=A0A383WA72_TETOB|eukprot:jgi/Sobl393_1/16879/SZX74100.1